MPEKRMPNLPELFSLEGRVAVVTGGSRGLGLEMAEGLGQAGARVVIAARRVEWLDTAASRLASAGIESHAHACDITVPEQAQGLVETAVTRFGGLDVLVNNAGVTWSEPFDTMPLSEWRRVLDVNLTGTFLVTQAAVRHMRSRRYGKIINTASVMGLVGLPAEILDLTGYTASKGAIIALTRDLAVKYGRCGIRVNAIAPGFFPTRMTQNVLPRIQSAVEATTPLGRLGQQGDLKGVVVFLASRASDYITGQVIAVDGGMTAG